MSQERNPSRFAAGPNFQGDKEEFAVRSGLISRARLFTPEELTELYRATDYFLEEGPEPDSGQQGALRQARTKIECTVPDLPTGQEQRMAGQIDGPAM